VFPFRNLVMELAVEIWGGEGGPEGV